MTKSIMLIHGAWLTPTSWDRFRARYEAKGYTVITPAWPHLNGTVAEINRATDPRLGKLGLKEIVDHYEAIIGGLPEQPILMGHSFGGLIVQLLMDRGLGAAGVAIDPGAPFGVLAHPIAVWTSRKVFLAWNGWNRALRMSLAGFAEGFANSIPKGDLRREYESQIVPTPGRIFFQDVLGIGSKVNWKNPRRAPLLLIAAEFDRTVPSPMVRANFKVQSRAPSVTAFHEFKNRSHYLCNEAGWEEVADHALNWAAEHDRTATRARPMLAAAA